MVEAAATLHSVFPLRYSVADINKPKALTSTQSIHWPGLQESTSGCKTRRFMICTARQIMLE